jgi:hypothetical protein
LATNADWYDRRPNDSNSIPNYNCDFSIPSWLPSHSLWVRREHNRPQGRQVSDFLERQNVAAAVVPGRAQPKFLIERFPSGKFGALLPMMVFEKR